MNRMMPETNKVLFYHNIEQKLQCVSTSNVVRTVVKTELLSSKVMGFWWDTRIIICFIKCRQAKQLQRKSTVRVGTAKERNYWPNALH